MDLANLASDIAVSLGVDPGDLRFIRYSQNIVYEYAARSDVTRILRLTLPSHRSREEIESELSWVGELREAGAEVCAAVPWEDGSLVRYFPELPESCHGVLIEKAPGRALARDDLTPDLYYLHGKHLGRLHVIARKQMPLVGRKRWDEERYFTTDLDSYIRKEVRHQVSQAWLELRAGLLAMPCHPDFYLPCHLDLGYSNLFTEGGRLWSFDFDNCAMASCAADIAFALYGSLFTLLRCEFHGDRSPFAHPGSSENLAKVWKPFYEGYRSESPWREEWFEQLPAWFDCAYFRSVIHAFRVQHLVTNPAVQAALDVDIRNILERNPSICFDFRKGRVVL